MGNRKGGDFSHYTLSNILYQGLFSARELILEPYWSETWLIVNQVCFAWNWSMVFEGLFSAREFLNHFGLQEMWLIVNQVCFAWNWMMVFGRN